MESQPNEILFFKLLQVLKENAENDAAVIATLTQILCGVLCPQEEKIKDEVINFITIGFDLYKEFHNKSIQGEQHGK